MKKIRISLTLIFILFIGLSTNAFASTDVVSQYIDQTLIDIYNDDVYSSKYAYYQKLDDSGTWCYLINDEYIFIGTGRSDSWSSRDTVQYVITSSFFGVYSVSDSSSTLCSFVCRIYDLDYNLLSSSMTSTYYDSFVNSYHCVTANGSDILSSLNGSSVFCVASTQTTTLWTAETIQAIPEMMTEALRVIIPVGLVLLSIGLLIYLIRLVISRVQ